MSDQIEIRIEGPGLTPEKFLLAAQSFFDLIQGVSENVGAKQVRWIAEVDKGSAVIRGRVANPSPESHMAIELVSRGIRSLRSGTKAVPNGFTREEVRACQVLADLADGEKITSILLQNGGAPEEVSKKIAPIAEAILKGENYTAFGSIEGKIDSLSDKQAFTCSIFDSLLRREVICYFQSEAVVQQAISGFRKRVLAGGLIRYGKEGHPTSIVVDTIRVFPDESELPTIEEVQAIFKQYAT